jgi:hypothetical protein
MKYDPQYSLWYSWHNEDIFYKGCMYLIKQSTLKSIVLSEFHVLPTDGHLGFSKTYEWVKHYFFWDVMKQDILTFVVECDTFQANKGEIVKSLGTLKLIPLPPTI